jgi:hypothetical protein
MARRSVPSLIEQLPDGTWRACKLGCTGLGATRLEACYDLEVKVELAVLVPCRRRAIVRGSKGEHAVAMSRALKALDNSCELVPADLDVPAG